MEPYIIQIIQTVGFPIALSIYLLWKSSKKTDQFLSKLDVSLDKINRNLLILNLSIAKTLNGKSHEFKRMVEKLQDDNNK